MHLPLIFSCWFMVATYVVHVIDESLMGGSFVEKVREHWWPEYCWTKFFWFNAGYFMLMIASVVLYDSLHGTWLILPLAWLIERFGNGFWHLAWAIVFANIPRPGVQHFDVDEFLLHRSLPRCRAGHPAGHLGMGPGRRRIGDGVPHSLHSLGGGRAEIQRVQNGSTRRVGGREHLLESMV